MTKDVFYNPSHLHRPAYLDLNEDDKLNGEMDANLETDKDASGEPLYVRSRDSARFINV